MTQTVTPSESASNDRVVTEYPQLGITIEGILNTDKETIERNIKYALSLGLEEVWPCKQQETEVVICAGGPTLLEHIEEIRQRQEAGAKVVALANVAHLLLAHNIRPNAHILLDAKPRNATFVTNCDTTLFISSQCDPEVFDNALKTNNRVILYHAINNPEEQEVVTDHYQQKVDETGNPQDGAWVPIQGGTTITMRAIRLFTILGYSKFHMYGWDSCLKEDQHHAYEQPDADKQPVFNMQFEDRMFRVTPWMISQLMEMQNFVKMFCMNIDMIVHGDGLIAYMIEKATDLTVDIQEDK